MAELIRRGYVQVLFGGNAIITHDIESVLFGTSLGVDVESGEQVEGGHRHHLRAINTIRAHGSVEQAIEAGVLKEGITYEAIKHHVTMVLAGSVRDDGPCQASSTACSSPRTACAKHSRGSTWR